MAYCNQCSYYQSPGQCRLPHSRTPDVGYFSLACGDYLDKNAMDIKTETKVCKTCGRELPLNAFGGHARTADHLQASCKECMSKKIKKGAEVRHKKKEADFPECPQEEHIPDGATVTIEREMLDDLKPELDRPIPIRVSLDELTEDQIVAKLRELGYTGTLTKTLTL